MRISLAFGTLNDVPGNIKTCGSSAMHFKEAKGFLGCNGTGPHASTNTCVLSFIFPLVKCCV